MTLNATNAEFHRNHNDNNNNNNNNNNVNDTYFTFELIRYNKTSKFIRLKKNETFASLYWSAESAFGQKCNLYIVNNETKNESPLLNCNDIVLEKFILNNPKYFIPSKENGSYKLNFYEDYYEPKTTSFL
jgi:hypothetical protein